MNEVLIVAIAAVVLALLWCIEINHSCKLKKELEEERDKRFNFSAKMYERHYRFLNIEHAGDNDTLNTKVRQFEADGYKYDHQGSNSFVLAFVKLEEVKMED